MPAGLAFLLLPLSWLYAGIMAVRNGLYDRGWKQSEAFAVPLVGVGNLRVGGTGKTPHVAWLLEELLRQGHRPAVLSRGYGRRTRGPRLAGPHDSAATVGDEPWQYYEQFGPRGVAVAVAEARRLGVALLLHAHPEITVVVLDDAYQHRAVRPALNLLLTEWARPFYADHVLPAGRLRESRVGARRADVIIATKCPPGAPAAARAAVARRIGRYARPGAPVLFSTYAYGPRGPWRRPLGRPRRRARRCCSPASRSRGPCASTSKAWATTLPSTPTFPTTTPSGPPTSRRCGRIGGPAGLFLPPPRTRPAWPTRPWRPRWPGCRSIPSRCKRRWTRAP